MTNTDWGENPENSLPQEFLDRFEWKDTNEILADFYKAESALVKFKDKAKETTKKETPKGNKDNETFDPNEFFAKNQEAIDKRFEFNNFLNEKGLKDSEIKAKIEEKVKNGYSLEDAYFIETKDLKDSEARNWVSNAMNPPKGGKGFEWKLTATSEEYREMTQTERKLFHKKWGQIKYEDK